MTSIAQLRFIPVIVRLASGGAYAARVPGKPLRCSNTQGFDNAANALGHKYYPSATVYRVGEPNPNLYNDRDPILAQIPTSTSEEQAFAKALTETGITHVIVP